MKQEDKKIFHLQTSQKTQEAKEKVQVDLFGNMKIKKQLLNH